MQAGLLSISASQSSTHVEQRDDATEEEKSLDENSFRSVIEAALNGESASSPQTPDSTDALGLPDVVTNNELSAALQMQDGTMQMTLSDEEILEIKQYGLWEPETSDFLSGPWQWEPESEVLTQGEWELAGYGALTPQIAIDANAGGGTDAAVQNEWLSELQVEQAALEADMLSADVGVFGPIASFASLPAQSWGTVPREAKLEQLQLVDVKNAKAGAVVSPLADAIASGNASLLNDGELAELDALIARVTQQAPGHASANAHEAKQQGTHESAEPSILSASHASQQTRPQEALNFKMVQATPTGDGEKPSPSEQVRLTISQAFRSGMDRIIIQLDPPEMGRVDVRMDLSNDGRAQIHIQADNRETLDLLQRDARMLERALQEAGLDANAQDMEFNLSQNDGDDEQHGTNDAMAQDYEETTEELRQAELLTDPFLGSYTLSIAQGLDIKV